MTGFFGVGGGFLIVPALTLLLGLVMRRAIATSLAIITLTGLAALVKPSRAGRRARLAADARPLRRGRGRARWPGAPSAASCRPDTLAHAFGVVVAVVALFLLVDVLALGGPPVG